MRTYAVLAAILLSTVALASPAHAQAIPQKNINAIGPTPVNWLYAGNPRMQQNEPEGVVSPNNPDWLAIGFNDYRGVNDSVIGDAFPGIAMSRDGGRTWISGLLPGNLRDAVNINKKFGADPNLEAVPYVMYYNFIAGWRDGSQPGAVFLSRWYEHNREVGPPWEFLDTIEIQSGTSGRFLDKPAYDVALRNPDDGLPDIVLQIPAFDDPRNPANSHAAYALPVPAHRMHLCYAVFVGNDNNDGTKINCLASDDGGATWPISNKLSESVEINQGVSIATANSGRDVLAVWTRFEDNNENSALVYATSNNFGDSWAKAKVLTEFCAFNQGTGAARHRTNALPVAVSNGSEFAVYFAARNAGTETCEIRGKGGKPDVPRLSTVALEDDFDSFEEDVDVEGNRIRDGLVRTSLNYSRVVMTRASVGNQLNWSTPVAVDPQEYPAGASNEDGSPIPTGSRIRGHQYMPAVEVAGGVEMLTWIDSRLDKLNQLPTPIPGGFVEDLVLHLEPKADGVGVESISLLPAGIYDLVPPPPNLPPSTNNVPLRRTVDIFAAQYAAHEGGFRQYTVGNDFYPSTVTGQAAPSVRVSRFATRQKPGAAPGVREQVEWDYPNARLFRKGKAPFVGDYNTAFAPQARQRADGRWISNQAPPAASDWFPSLDPTFHIGWTSNRDVRGKVFYTGCDEWDETLQMWVASEGCDSVYTDPNPGMMMPLQGEDGSNDGPPMSCFAAQTIGAPVGPLTRNQNIYTAAMRPGISVDVASAIKLPDGTGFNTFVLNVQNGSKINRRVRLAVQPGQMIDFDKNPLSDLFEIEVVVPKGAANTRTLFDIADVITGPVLVDAYDITGLPAGSQGTLVARVPLLRDALVPLENVQNNDPDPNARIDLVGPAGTEFYNLILKREIGTTQFLDLENLDLENTVSLLDLENLDLENLDLENQVLFLDLENLDLENLDLENALYANLDLENTVVNLDLENLDLENRLLYLDLENLDLENLDLENLDLENLDLENLDLESLDLENLDLENFTVFASDIENLDLENLDLENLDLENVAPGDEYLEVSWTADSATNTTTGVDIKPIFSPALQQDLATAGTVVVLTVRQGYLTGTVSVNQTSGDFCTPQVVAQNQVIYSTVLTPDQINELIADPEPTNANTPSFVIDPDGSKIITLRYINPPADMDVGEISANSGLAIYSQPGEEPLCDAELGGNEVFNVCEVDYTEPVDEPPTISLIGANPLTVEATIAAFVDPGAIGDDAEDGELVAQLVASNVDAAVPGSYSVQYRVVDSGGSEAFVTRVVDVVDTTEPTITLPADITVEASGPLTPLTLVPATAVDIVAGPIEITSDAPAQFPLGATIVNWFATDAAGNIASGQQTVTVSDSTGPQITLTGGDQVLEANADGFSEPGFTAIDTVSGDVSALVVVTGSVNTAVIGVYTLTYTASDASGNTSSATRTVTVEDNTPPGVIGNFPPVFVPTGPFILEPDEDVLTIGWPISASDLANGLSVTCSVGEPPQTLVPTATNYDTGTGILSADFSFDFGPGTTQVECTITDQGGNSATTPTFSVIVEDIPLIEVLSPTLGISTDANGSITATISDAQLAANVTASDRIDGDLTTAVSCLSTDTAEFAIGQHDIECSVTDSAGNSASVSFSLEVNYRFGFVYVVPKGNVRAGSTVPLDWYYVDPASGDRVDSSGFDVSASWLGPFSDRNCSTQGSDFGLGDGEDSGSSDFRYTGSQQQWQFSWQTPELSGSYLFTVAPPGSGESTICINLR